MRIDSDSALLHAFDVYWDSRKVPLTVHVVDTGPRLLKSKCCNANASQSSQSVIITQESQVNCQPIAMILPNLVADDNGEAVDLNDDGNCEADANGDEGLNLDNDGEDDDAIAEEEEDIAEDDWEEADEVEYVGVDDENEKYKDGVNDDGDADPAYYPDSDPEDDDPLVVDDGRDCDGVVHVTDIDNPKIGLGVTFEDGFCFKRCIRQYAVLNEVELVVPYSASWRYRAYCKAQRCPWRIHASQLPDGKTWQVCELCNASFSLI